MPSICMALFESKVWHKIKFNDFCIPTPYVQTLYTNTEGIELQNLP